MGTFGYDRWVKSPSLASFFIETLWCTLADNQLGVQAYRIAPNGTIFHAFQQRLNRPGAQFMP